MKYNFELKVQKLIKFRDELKTKLESLLDCDKFYVSDLPEIKFFDNRLYILDIRVKGNNETKAKIDEYGVVHYMVHICNNSQLMKSLQDAGFIVEIYDDGFRGD